MPPQTRTHEHTTNQHPAHPAGQDERNTTPTERNDGNRSHHTTSAPPEAPISHRDTTKKATITISSININGYNAPSHNMSGSDKWSAIYRTMNDQKIAILAIQETHLDQELIDNVVQCHSSRLTIITSPDPDTPRSSAGVAFVINKRLMNPSNITIFELIEGRALALKIKWHNNEETVILNIYAPNYRPSQPEFWRKVEAKKRLYRLRNPDFMLGDFNVTEDAIDRSPPHLDDPNATAAIRENRHNWSLQDVWRHAYPNSRVFTYRAISNNQPIKSRIDRIYISSQTAQHCFNWQHNATPIPTDHWMVSVKYAPLDAPYIGKGRWTWNTPSLQNKILVTTLIERGTKLQADIDHTMHNQIDRATNNPQLLWHQYKNDIRTIAKRHNKNTYHKINSRANHLKKDINEITQHEDFDTNDVLRTTEALLAQEIEHLEKLKARNKKDKLRAEIALHGEKLGGIWSALNKENKPRDLICRLRIPNSTPPQYERCSKRMAQLARNYHEALQQSEQPYEDPIAHNTHLENILNEITDEQKLENPTQSSMNWEITQDQVQRALSLTKNNTATGLDGCPYELWKTMNDNYNRATAEHNQNQKTFNIIAVLTAVFNDIRNHGVDQRTDFVQGWMCPIYKKKDRTEISNYRPITLLNTDYKIFTKVLALQLMDHIHSLLHEDQAGFIPRRSIFNHIRLAQSIITYAETTEMNGAIIALDQEKAYDKIHHNYLWKTLETFNLPHPFIRMIKSLYQNATTRVAINGVLSTPFDVKRGVRQGDPLSCTLFDLAIEPLACKIRNNPTIQGIHIPTLQQNPKILMFADDTTIFLNEYDSLDNVQENLDHWCTVSGAHFNIDKTEIVPIGTEEYRKKVIDTRKINQHDVVPLDPRINIAKDGEAIRSLGAWIGNKTDANTPWEPILDKIKKDLDRWNRSKPTLQGRRIIVQAVIGGRTQFLTKAQGMPISIEKALTKIARNFMWEDDSSPRIALNYLSLPPQEGGLNLLDIHARNEAIEIIWLKTYLNFTPSRPAWATVTDLIINKAAPPGTSHLARMNTFLQTWDAPSRGTRLNLLNNSITRMLQAARKYNVNLAAIRISPQLRGQLPAWYHPMAKPRPIVTRPAKCLLRRHAITKVTDLIMISNRIRTPNPVQPHLTTPACPCPACERDRLEGCPNPHQCAQEALTRIQLIEPKMNPLSPEFTHGNFSLTPTRKEANTIARNNNDEILFDPSITCKNSLAECFRIFTNPNKISKLSASRNFTRQINLRHRGVTIYTDGACYNNGKLNARCGSGIWYAPNDPRNESIRIPGPHQSNQAGEIAAVIQAADVTPPFQPLTIISDSKYVIKGLTENLSTWEDIGWIGIKNTDLFKRAAYLLKRRTAPTYFKWIKAHNGDQGNEECDHLAKRGANKPHEDILNLEVPVTFDLQGAKLEGLNQATAYRGIMEIRTHLHRATTTENLQITREAIHNYNSLLETDETIWASIRRRTLRTRIKQFLYKSIHGTQKIGKYWRHIPNNEQREFCTICEEMESMEHILVNCQAMPRRQIWMMARDLWPHEQDLWPEINLGTILGCGALSPPAVNEWEPNERRNEQRNAPQQPRGTIRLLQILISESAYLIWTLRCERVIGNPDHRHNEREIRTRWLRAINLRLTEDKIITTRIKRDKQTKQLVRGTWEPVLRKSLAIPNDWLYHREVLVGRNT